LVTIYERGVGRFRQRISSMAYYKGLTQN
jgi:hypothetical protein